MHSTKAHTLHATYCNSSPYYGMLVARFGRTLSWAQAAVIANEHGTTITILVEEENLITKEGKVNTLDLVLSLGY